MAFRPISRDVIRRAHSSTDVYTTIRDGNLSAGTPPPGTFRESQGFSYMSNALDDHGARRAFSLALFNNVAARDFLLRQYEFSQDDISTVEVVLQNPTTAESQRLRDGLVGRLTDRQKSIFLDMRIVAGYERPFNSGGGNQPNPGDNRDHGDVNIISAYETEENAGAAIGVFQGREYHDQIEKQVQTINRVLGQLEYISTPVSAHTPLGSPPSTLQVVTDWTWNHPSAIIAGVGFIAGTAVIGAVLRGSGRRVAAAQTRIEELERGVVEAQATMRPVESVDMTVLERDIGETRTRIIDDLEVQFNQAVADLARAGNGGFDQAAFDNARIEYENLAHEHSQVALDVANIEAADANNALLSPRRIDLFQIARRMDEAETVYRTTARGQRTGQEAQESERIAQRIFEIRSEIHQWEATGRNLQGAHEALEAARSGYRRLDQIQIRPRPATTPTTPVATPPPPQTPPTTPAATPPPLPPPAGTPPLPPHAPGGGTARNPT